MYSSYNFGNIILFNLQLLLIKSKGQRKGEYWFEKKEDLEI